MCIYATFLNLATTEKRHYFSILSPKNLRIENFYALRKFADNFNLRNNHHAKLTPPPVSSQKYENI